MVQRLPDGEPWLPNLAEVLEDGEGTVGPFRDTWVIWGVTAEEAQEVIDLERNLVAAIDSLATNEDQFDALAAVIESGDDELLLDNDLGLSERILDDVLTDEFMVIGLELGVAGLVHGLAAAGLLTAASCRGHPQSHRWTDVPTVHFVGDQARLTVLSELAAETDCGITYEQQLTTIWAPSITSTMAFAQRLVDRSGELDEMEPWW